MNRGPRPDIELSGRLRLAQPVAGGATPRTANEGETW
jgi:hypothetical protein